MPMRFLFDQVEGHYIRDTEQGIEINRPALVVDIPIVAGPGATDPSVFLKILKDTNCPLKGAAYPDATFSWAKLRERNLRNVRDNSSAIVDFIYRGVLTTLGPGGTIEYIIEDAHITETVQSMATADGSEVTIVHYKRGHAAIGASPTPPMYRKGTMYPKLRSSRVIRARGNATAAVWQAIRPTIKGLRNNINDRPWGGEPRGTWMFMGPTTIYGAGNTRVDITLDFIEGIDGHFPILAYFNEFGDHPADCTTEKTLRNAGLPAVNKQVLGNGLTIASGYPEANFNTYFTFTP